ncbi:MAG: NAD(P)-dependent oxidoreductase [bacterium]
MPGSRRPSPPARAARSHPPRASGEDLRQDIRTVLVTGAGGPIGSFLVHHLAREGFAVVAADQPGSDIPLPKARSPIVARTGDLSSPVFLKSLLEGVDAVIHAAPCVGIRQPYDVLAPLVVETPRVLYAGCRRRAVKRFLYLSSGQVYKRGQSLMDETSALEAEDDYQQALMDAEKALLAEAAPGLPLVTVLRVAVSYGPRNGALISSLATLPVLARALGPCCPLLSGGPRMNLIHGEDAARAALFLLFQAGSYGEVFNVADKDPMSLSEFINVAMETYGLKRLEPGTPYPPLTLLQSILPYMDSDDIFDPLNKLGCSLWDRMVRKLGLQRALTPRIDQEMLLFGRRDLMLASRKLTSLGFRHKYPKFHQGWERTVAWYQENRWIPGPNEI